jgi:phosphoribosylformylglycinamidine cyclo-ligase
MNANDILCVGARPISMVDYIAVQKADPKLLAEIAKGLCEGARAAQINIPGGEIAQVRELLHDAPDERAFDLVGTCVGTVHPERILIGASIRPGDLVVGLASSGVHSNGLTLARRVLFDRARLNVDTHRPELGRTVGEELLEPTCIYVRAATRMLEAELDVKAFIHVTGDGFLNLARVAAPVGFVIDSLLPRPAIFSLIQDLGEIDDAEIFRVYNMGLGFCVVVNPRDASRVQAIAAEHGHHAAVIGYTVADERRSVWIPAHNLVGRDKRFHFSRQAPPACPV